jgi:3-keto-L-gulonate-6-phosphate decarboxylase
MRPFVYFAHAFGQRVTFAGTNVSWGANFGTVVGVSREEAIGKTLEKAQKIRPDLIDSRAVDALVLELSREKLLKLLEHARPQSEIDAELAAKEAVSEAESE